MKPHFQSRVQRTLAFTLIELLVVIGVIAILAALTTGVVGSASRKAKLTRIGAELKFLETAIEDYKSQMGMYPPDSYNSENGRTDPFVPPLYYELSGVIADNQNNQFRMPGDSQPIPFNPNNNPFRSQGFANVAAVPSELKFSLSDLDADMVGDLGQSTAYNHPGLKVLVVPVPWAGHEDVPGEIEDPLVQESNPLGAGVLLNTWRYVSTSPTNNPGRFDLWAEVSLGGKAYIVGNWEN